VQKPFFPEGPALPHLYLLHPPGGLVSGDDLRVDIEVADGAAALFTTPGAGRYYRARPDRQLQRSVNRLTVGTGATCEWLPLENIVYSDASAELVTEVALAENSRFIGWDLTALGLQASKQPFVSGEVLQRLSVTRGGRPWLHEQLRLDMRDAQLFHGSVGLRGHCVHGLLLAGPFETEAQTKALVTRLRDSAAVLPHPVDNAAPDLLWNCTALRGFVLLRCLADHTESARRLLRHAWAQLRPPLLQRVACAPRIWAT
jgi:urease accessory protein